METLEFPKNFFWGASTSAHQVEGQNKNNDWWRAEQLGLVPHQSGQAANHYELFAKDFALAKQLDHNAHRFSIEWSRLEPEPGAFDQAATIHYRKMLIALREMGIEPIVTLHHFTNPQWFANLGGWQKPEAVKFFLRYVAYCLEHFGDYVNWWLTFNEPENFATMAYGQGVWPPFKKNWWAVLRVCLNLAKAHRRAYKKIHAKQPKAKVGMAHAMIAYAPANSDNFLNLALTRIVKFFRNDLFIKLLWKHFDFIGLNYYFYARITGRLTPSTISPANALRSDLGWAIAPQGLTQVLRELHRFRKPIIITENGLADRQDTLRKNFIINHLLAIYAAIAEGINVRGYLHWSLLDSFEWQEGFSVRFGLIEVDLASQARTIRPSAWILSEIIKANGVPTAMLSILNQNKKQPWPEAVKRAFQKINRVNPLKS